MSNKLLSRLVACLGLAASLAQVPSALAATETKTVGNQNGKQFASECPAGKAVFGWQYNSDDRLRAIAVLCIDIDEATGTTGGIAKPAAGGLVGGDFGLGGGAGSGERTCQAGQAVQSLTVKLTDAQSIHSLRATCHGPGTAPVLIKSTDLAAGAPAAVSSSNADCGARTYATALVGTFKNSGPNQGILSLGLRCSAIGETMAAGPAANDNAGADPGAPANGGGAPAEGDPDGFRIELGPDGIRIGGGRRGGNDGDTRFADEPTTIYAKPAGDEIAYLEQGDTVTIVQCEDNGRGWCQISDPTRGWVWGGDLN